MGDRTRMAVAAALIAGAVAALVNLDAIAGLAGWLFWPVAVCGAMALVREVSRWSR